MLRAPAIRSSWLALVLAVLLAACQPKAIPMTPEETQRVESLTAHMATRCVGRYLIDMPQSFVLNSESRTEIEGVKVAVQPMTKWLFEKTLEAREMVLRRERIIGETSPSLLSVTELKSGLGVVLNRSRTGESAVLRTLELIAFKDGYAITMQINSRDMAFAEPDPTDTRKTDTPEKLAHLLKVYERVSGRKDTEVPTAPGLCIPNGFVAGATREGQDTGAVYHLADAPDVWFGITSDGTIGAMSTLFQRSSEIEQGMSRAGVKTFRKAERRIHGEPYEEWLLTNTPYQDEVRGTRFVLHGNEAADKPDQPFIKLAMYNGDRIPVPELTMAEKDKLRLNEILTKATLTDPEAVAIWDKVSSTLRPRPGAF